MGSLRGLDVLGPFQVKMHARGSQNHILSLEVFMGRERFGEWRSYIGYTQEPVKPQQKCQPISDGIIKGVTQLGDMADLMEGEDTFRGGLLTY